MVKLCKTPDCEKKRYANISWCYSHYLERERNKREEKKERALIRKQNTIKYQKSEKKKWHLKTWKLMSRWVRLSKADWRGYIPCYTCPEIKLMEEMSAGHWKHDKLDFDNRNIKPQCVVCNLHFSGRLDVYSVRLMREYGVEWVEQLEIDAARHLGYSLEELKQIHADLTEKLKTL